MRAAKLLRAARVLLALLSSAVALGFAEVATRILLRPGPSTPIQGTPISEISPTLGWRARPGGSQRIRREDFDVTVSINARGLRGPELPYEAAAGRRRLAILGDSFAHGYYAEEADTVAGRLRSALAPCAVDVVNGGGPGYSTDQEWMFYNEEIARYAPREVVVLFYYNDLFFNVDAMGTNPSGYRAGSVGAAPAERQPPGPSGPPGPHLIALDTSR